MATQPEPDETDVALDVEPPAELVTELEVEPETGPLRRCLVTREQVARAAGLRFVVGPDARLVFDVAATLPGRGLWLSAKADVISMAIKRGVFSRAAKQRVDIPAELAGIIEALLMRRVTELLGLARRGGGAISGFEKAREWLVEGRAGLVVQASDGSVEERARFIGGRNVAVVSPLDAERLGRVFGREHAVHVVIAPGKLAAMIEMDANRLAGVAGRQTSGHIAPSVEAALAADRSMRDGPD
ncbi:MAG: RNA-binding protein [Acidocella sp.]|nr:RNA-binding protein [Acidocella sp.]